MTNTRKFLDTRTLLLLLAAVAPTGCDGVGDNAAATEDVGSVQLELVAAPADAACIKLTVTTGGQTSTRNISPTAGSRTVAVLSDLAVGPATFSGQAYAATCDTSPLPDAAWVADPVTVTITAGNPASFQLSFHRKEKAYVSLDFPANVPLPPRTMNADSTECAALPDATIHCHGSNYAGKAGDFTSTYNGRANTVLRLDAKKIATNHATQCALLSDGGVSCWGSNYLTPTRISGVYAATDITVGYEHFCAVSYGSVVCWGSNKFSQLGQGDNVPYTWPVSVPNLQDVVAVGSSWGTTCAVTKAGAVYCWGQNESGQAGDGTTNIRTTPWPIKGLTNVIGISGGDSHMCALQGNGVVQCWGLNNYGQLGDGTTTQRLTPVGVPGLGFSTQVAAGGAHTCALHQDGTMRCWGWDAYGQIGDGTAFTSTATRGVTKVTNITSIIEIAAGTTNSCARMPDSVYCWGDDTSGQLDGGSTSRSTPVLQSW